MTFSVLYGRVELLRAVGDAASALAAAETLLDRSAASGQPGVHRYHACGCACQPCRWAQITAAQLLEATSAGAQNTPSSASFNRAGSRQSQPLSSGSSDIARQWIERVAVARLTTRILRGRLDLADARVAATEGKPLKAREAYTRARDALASLDETWLTAMLREAGTDVLVAEGKIARRQWTPCAMRSTCASK